MLGTFWSELEHGRGAWCSKFAAKNRSKRTFSEKMMFAILALVGWFPDPSWLIPRGFGWQIKPGICQKSVKMGTRFGAHFLVLFFVQKVDRQLSKLGQGPAVMVQIAHPSRHPFAQVILKTCPRQTSKKLKFRCRPYIYLPDKSRQRIWNERKRKFTIAQLSKSMIE